MYDLLTLLHHLSLNLNLDLKVIMYDLESHVLSRGPFQTDSLTHTHLHSIPFFLDAWPFDPCVYESLKRKEKYLRGIHSSTLNLGPYVQKRHIRVIFILEKSSFFLWNKYEMRRVE